MEQKEVSEAEVEQLLEEWEQQKSRERRAGAAAVRLTPGEWRWRKVQEILYSHCLPILYGIVAALILTQVLFFHAKVPSGSMETTILTGDRIVGSRTAYWFQEPDYGDIIIFWSEEYNEFMVKRIVGCSGDRVEIREDGVYVNDKKLAEDYTQGATEALKTGADAWTVPDDSYFVMGDNRENSADSRYWEESYVPADEIYARYMFRYSLGRNGWYLDWNDPVTFWAE